MRSESVNVFLFLRDVQHDDDDDDDDEGECAEETFSLVRHKSDRGRERERRVQITISIRSFSVSFLAQVE